MAGGGNGDDEGDASDDDDDEDDSSLGARSSLAELIFTDYSRVKQYYL